MKTSSLFLKLQILLLSLNVLMIQAQDNDYNQKIDLFRQNYATFSKNYPQEKVYLHIDNTAYYMGETIWFKAYVVRAEQNSLNPLSKVLYVELVNAEGYVVETVKLKIVSGQCYGCFKPIASGYAGFYEVRAYTSYMLNFGLNNYFTRVFPVYDKPKIDGDYNPQMIERLNSQRIPQLRPEFDQKEQLTVNFYPEGGNLIAGLPSTVAFKATDKKGRNAIISGVVYNEKDEKVAEFSTEYQAMGSFRFTPVAGRYTAKVNNKNKEYKFELPTVLPTGFAMSVDNSDPESIKVLILKNANTNTEQLGLCVSCRGRICNFQFINSTGKELIVPKKLLSGGVTQITLYNARGDVLSERLVFVNQQNNHLKMEVSQSKQIFEPFEKTAFEFRLKDAENNPVETSFSVSVTDGSTSSINPFGNNIMTDLLLSSELKGYIENPGYYFQADDINHRHALDLLMLTQGWTRYSWKKMTASTPFVLKYPVENELAVDGTVYSLLMKKIVKGADITMVMSVDSIAQYGKFKTDSTGKFYFALRDFNGVGKLALQSRQNGKRTEMFIELNRNFTPNPRPYSFAELNIPQYFNTLKESVMISGVKRDSTENSVPKNNDKLQMDKRVFLLSEVTVKDKRKPVKISVKYDVAGDLEKRKDAGLWMPSDINTFLHFTCDYYNASTGMYKGKHVVFVRDAFVSELIMDMTNAGGADGEVIPALTNLYSGGPMPYLEEIESVSFIEDFSSILRIFNGNIDPSANVIALIHVKRNYRNEPYGVRNTTFNGYSYVKEFYSPQYDKMILPGEKDYRRTLYWNPDVKTDKDGKAVIDFYNNSSCKVMNISAETVTENGMIGTLNK